MKDILLVIGVIILCIASLFRGLLVKDEDSIRAAETMGFSNVVVVNSNWFFAGLSGCDWGDAKAVTLDAVNPAGNTVQIIACSGFPFKGWTVRTK